MVEQLLLDRKDYERLEKEINDKSEKAENYRAEHNITDEIDETDDTVSIEQLRSNVNGYRSLLASLQREISAAEAEVNKLDEYYSEKETLEEKLSGYQKKYKLLSAAQGFLKEASDAMNNRYVEPVLRELQANSATLGDAIGKPITLNRDFELLFEEGGKLRSEKHLSAGQRTLCALCFRISLIKNLYRDSAPFVILDDPFATLDEANMERARSLVSMLAEEMQILYFTCHGSRSITAQNG